MPTTSNDAPQQCVAKATAAAAANDIKMYLLYRKSNYFKTLPLYNHITINNVHKLINEEVSN